MISRAILLKWGQTSSLRNTGGLSRKVVLRYMVAGRHQSAQGAPTTLVAFDSDMFTMLFLSLVAVILVLLINFDFQLIKLLVLGLESG